MEFCWAVDGTVERKRRRKVSSLLARVSSTNVARKESIVKIHVPIEHLLLRQVCDCKKHCTSTIQRQLPSRIHSIDQGVTTTSLTPAIPAIFCIPLSLSFPHFHSPSSSSLLSCLFYPGCGYHQIKATDPPSGSPA